MNIHAIKKKMRAASKHKRKLTEKNKWGNQREIEKINAANKKRSWKIKEMKKNKPKR